MNAVHDAMALLWLQGSYAALDGGSTLWALEALTGDYVFKFRYDGSNVSLRLQYVVLVNCTS
jgi:hypothetical protein